MCAATRTCVFSLALASLLALVLVLFPRVCTCVRTLVLPVLTHIRARAHAFTCTSTRTRIYTRNCTRARPQTFRAHDHARNPRARTTRCTRTTTPMFTRWTTGTTERTDRDPQHRTRHPSRTHLVTLARSSLFVVGRERSAADVDYVVCQVWNAYRGPQDAAILPVLLPRDVLFALYGQHGSCDARPFNGWKAIDRFGRRGHDRDRAIARRCDPKVGPHGELDMVTMGLPGLTGRWKALRVRLFVGHHSWALKLRTMGDALGLLRWFMDQAVVGVMPQNRHDGSALAGTDVLCKRGAGRQLLCQSPRVPGDGGRR